MAMTSKERISNILKRKPVDRIGLFEHFWGDTQKAWTTQGHLKEGESLYSHFDYSIPDQCKYETYRFLVDEGLRLGTC